MAAVRIRAKEQLPHVLLTLLSIIQALALELLWSKLRETAAGPPWSAAGLLYWLQAASIFLGIVVVWLVYVSNVMRFRWVPGIADSLHPFAVGLLQFMMIETLGSPSLGLWLLLMATTFALMNWVAHSTMRRARRDADNAAFFRHVQPATWRDFYGAFASVGALAGLGVLLLLWPAATPLALAAVLLAFALLALQLWVQTYFWNRSMGEPPADD